MINMGKPITITLTVTDGDHIGGSSVTLSPEMVYLDKTAFLIGHAEDLVFGAVHSFLESSRPNIQQIVKANLVVMPHVPGPNDAKWKPSIVASPVFDVAW